MTGRATGKNFFAEAKDILVRSVPGDINPLPPSLESTDLVNAIATLAAMAGDVEVQYLPGVITVDTSLPGDGSGDIEGKSYHSFAAAYAFTHSHPDNYYKIELPAGRLNENIIVENNLIVEGNNTQVNRVLSYCWRTDFNTWPPPAKVKGIVLLSGSGSQEPGESNTIYEAETGKIGYLWLEDCEIQEEKFITDSSTNTVYLVVLNCTFQWYDDAWGIHGPIYAVCSHCLFAYWDFFRGATPTSLCRLASQSGGILNISESTFLSESLLDWDTDSSIEVSNCTFYQDLRLEGAEQPLKLYNCTLQGETHFAEGNVDARDCRFTNTIHFLGSASGNLTFTGCSGKLLSGYVYGNLKITDSVFPISSVSVTGDIHIIGSQLQINSGGSHLTANGNVYLNDSTVNLTDIAGGAQPDEPGIIINNSTVKARMGSAENNTSAIVSMSRSKLETTYLESETGNTEHPLPEIAAADSEIVFHIPAGTLNLGDTYTFRQTMLEHSSFTVDLIPVSGSSAMTNLLYFPEKDPAADANLILSRSSCVLINQPYAGDPVSSHIQWYSGGAFNPQWTAKWKSDVTSYIDETVFGAAHKAVPDERDRIVIRYAANSAGANMSASSTGASYVGFMSKLGGDPSVPGNFVWVPLNSTVVDDDTASATDSITLADSTVFNRGELTSLTVAMPSGITPAFTAQINFTSGTAATQFTDSSVPAAVFTGDDTNAGVFTPVQNKRYMVLFTYDGVSSRGMVSAVDAVPQV